MASVVSREEFSILEREVEGEKLVTRHILEQTRRNGDDLAAIKTRLDRFENRLDGVEGRLGRVEYELRQLRADLPAVVAETMRDVLRERGERA